jgi:putative transposase
MARRMRLCPLGIPQHIIQRGNNRTSCFGRDQDCAAYANWLAEAAERYAVHLHAWVFMTNHVHLLATPYEPRGVSKMMQFIGRRYVQHFNYIYARTGTLWEGRFKSCLVDGNNYLLYCYRYIELNPVRAGIVATPGEYPWSSYAANAMGVESRLRTPHPLYLNLGTTPEQRSERYCALFRTHQDGRALDEIRTATSQGLVFGGERFKDDIEALTGQRTRVQKRGPTRPKKLGSE